MKSIAFNVNSYFSRSATLVLAIAFGAVGCQAQSSRGPQVPSQVLSEAETMVARLWRAITAKCTVGEGGSQATYLQYGNVRATGAGYWLAYTDARVSLFPIPLTAADTLNGTQFKGLAVLRGTAHRSINNYVRKWSDWEPESRACKSFDRNTLITRATSTDDDIYGDQAVFACWPEITVFKVEKRKGQWSFADKRQGATERKLLESDLSENEAMPSCAVLQSDNPFRK